MPPTDGNATSILDSGTPDRARPSLLWTACDVKAWPTGYPPPHPAVKCATVEVPLDHSRPAGATFKLRVGRHSSRSYPSGKAMFHLAGGPGGGATFASGFIPVYLAQLLDDVDLIYVDQRGTGGSGQLSCPAGSPKSRQDWVACASQHASKNLDRYSTVNAAHDLDIVRTRLGYDRIYIQGGSYGTRLGLEYIRQHGDRVAAAVLDGLATPDWDAFGGMVESLGKGVAKLVKDCTVSAACKAAVPDLAGDLNKRRLALKSKPRPFIFGGKLYHEDEQTFVVMLQEALDRSKTRYRVPRAIHDALGGDNTAWNTLLSTLLGAPVSDGVAPLPRPVASPRRAPSFWASPLGPSYSAPGLYGSIVCSEWFPNSGGLARLKASMSQQEWVRADRLETAAACSSWKVTPLAAALRQPVTSKVRTLLLSGENDMRTPPERGSAAAKTLPNSTHVVVPYQGHSTINNACASQLVVDFFRAAGDMSAVSIACLQSISHPGW